MAKRRNYTQELLAKQADGHIVVVSMEPHRNLPVTYSPRKVNDPEPWDAGLAYRFTGRECHAIKPVPVSQFHKDVAVYLIEHLYDGAFQMGADDFGFDFRPDHLTTLMVALTAEGLLERHGDTFVITLKGSARLTEIGKDAA